MSTTAPTIQENSDSYYHQSGQSAFQPLLVDDMDKNTSTRKIPFHRTRDGRIIIILVITIFIGVIIGATVGRTRTLALEGAQRDTNTAPTTTVLSTTTTSVVLSITTTTLLTTSTITLSASPPTPSNCIWEGTAPFCDGKCHTGFTQIKEDNCGSGECCATGFKVFCCQE